MSDPPMVASSKVSVASKATCNIYNIVSKSIVHMTLNQSNSMYFVFINTCYVHMQVIVENRSRKMNVKQAVSTGVLFMVDLAGSERAAVTQVQCTYTIMLYKYKIKLLSSSRRVF